MERLELLVLCKNVDDNRIVVLSSREVSKTRRCLLKRPCVGSGCGCPASDAGKVSSRQSPKPRHLQWATRRRHWICHDQEATRQHRSLALCSTSRSTRFVRCRRERESRGWRRLAEEAALFHGYLGMPVYLVLNTLLLICKACDLCRSRKTRCDEDRPRCGYCRTMNLECTYQVPRATKRDQSMTVAINAIRRLEAKIEDLTAVVSASKSAPALPTPAPAQAFDHRSPISTFSQPSPRNDTQGPLVPRHDRFNVHEPAMSPQAAATPGRSPLAVSEIQSTIALSFSQHRVAIWPAVKQVLASEFVTASAELPQDYVADIESRRAPLPIQINRPLGTHPDSWLMDLSQSVVKGLQMPTSLSSIATLPY